MFTYVVFVRFTCWRTAKKLLRILSDFRTQRMAA